jgi:hypothetical protein
MSSLVVVPVGGMSRLTAEGVSAALSLGDEVIAVTVCYADPDDAAVHEHFSDQWEAWHPNVPLVTLHTHHRALAPPIVNYLRQLEAEDRYHRLVVLIPEMQALHAWQRILHNQRGFVLDRAIQEDTSNVVICRLRFRPTTWSSPAVASVTYPDAAAQRQSSAPKGDGPGRGGGVRGGTDDGG